MEMEDHEFDFLHDNVTDMRWANAEKTAVDCTVHFRRLGPVPYTAALIDHVDHGQTIWDEIIDGEYGEPEPYIPPTADQLRANFPELSPPRFWKAARQIGLTKDMVLEVINAVPDANVKDDMLIDLEECTGFIRLNPTVTTMAALFEIPPEQLDTLWLWAADTQA
jgi:hypothetical protein